MAGGISLPEGHYSIKEAAQKSGYSEDQLRRMDRAGIVRAKRQQFGRSDYRIYTEEEISALKTLKSDEARRKITYMETHLMDLLADYYKWSEPFRSFSEQENPDTKTITITFKYQHEEGIDELQHLFTKKKR